MPRFADLIPGVTPLKVAGYAIAGLAVLFMAFLVIRFVQDPASILGLWKHKAVKEAARADQAEGQAKVGAGQTALDADARTILDKGAQQQRVILDIRQGNANALATAVAPGADTPLDPAFMAAARRGLCRYPAYADDPGCAEVRAGDIGQLPPAG